jgi:predicted adenine nucleotide alpha hydrolase (AANH) superfamily ATPase
MKPALLLHACCAPCSSGVLERLVNEYDVTLFYYNPNIHPVAEYERRLEELRRFLPRFPPAAAVPLVETAYDTEDFYRAAGAREDEALAREGERGERCARCYRLRLEKAYGYAGASAKNGQVFDYVCTTLSVSPHKDASLINAIGAALEERYGSPKFLAADFKKKDGFKRSLALSRDYGLYRQTYCGCEYSMVQSGA